jgi:hypothetical protein
LSKWIIRGGTLIVLAVALGVAAVIWFVLLRRYIGQDAKTQLDVIRTAGTLVIGVGGTVALLLTARRQRYTELTLMYTDRDAIERRITELYTKAADQLGSDQAPVRLAGLYDLERLAHIAVEHRQTIVDVICAYLRMPYTPPQRSASTVMRSYRSLGPARRRQVRTLTRQPLYATPTSREARQEHAEQEKQVRLAAQDIVLRNLRVAEQGRQRWWHRAPPPEAPAWPGIRLDLTGAVLLEFFLAECQLDYANFTRAQFTGHAHFEGTQFIGGPDFWGAQFIGGANFRNAKFPDGAYFGGAQFIAGPTSGVPNFPAGPTLWAPSSPAPSASCTPGSPAGLTSRAHGWPRPLSRNLCGRRVGRPDLLIQPVGKIPPSCI